MRKRVKNQQEGAVKREKEGKKENELGESCDNVFTSSVH
jgi:hypothetical protein